MRGKLFSFLFSFSQYFLLCLFWLLVVNDEGQANFKVSFPLLVEGISRTCRTLHYCTRRRPTSLVIADPSSVRAIVKE
jgi:hypothetical protein